MIKIGEYLIEEYPNQNKITILLPQTSATATSTMGVVFDNRKMMLSDTELGFILQVVRCIYEGEHPRLDEKRVQELAKIRLEGTDE